MGFLSFRFPLFAGGLLLLYYAIPAGQWVLLLVAGFCFYLGEDGKNLIFLLLTILLAYTVTLGMARNQQRFDRNTAKGKNRKWLWLSIGPLLGMLGFFKFRLTLRPTALPFGISFYLFQALGYVVDVYRGSTRVRKNPGHLALFLCYFPQLTQGPISRCDELLPRLLERHRFEKKAFCLGLQRMLWGYFKKLVIADRIAPAVAALKAPGTGGNAFLLLTLLYAIEIYGDFTGGMDLAIGLSEMLGIPLAENFDCPFFSKNIAQYWRKWHITLGEWMKNYIFFPLCVSTPLRKLSRRTRKHHPELGKRLPVYLATVVTWLCTGIWHGITPNFLLWGMMNCTVILVSEALEPRYRRFRSRFSWTQSRWYAGFEILRTFLLMNFIRIVDLFPDVGDYFRNLGSLFSGGKVGLEDLALTVPDCCILALGCAGMLGVSLFRQRYGSLREALWKRPCLGFWLSAGLMLAVLLLGRYGMGYDPVNFIYNQF